MKNKEKVIFDVGTKTYVKYVRNTKIFN